MCWLTHLGLTLQPEERLRLYPQSQMLNHTAEVSDVHVSPLETTHGLPAGCARPRRPLRWPPWPCRAAGTVGSLVSLSPWDVSPEELHSARGAGAAVPTGSQTSGVDIHIHSSPATCSRGTHGLAFTRRSQRVWVFLSARPRQGRGSDELRESGATPLWPGAPPPRLTHYHVWAGSGRASPTRPLEGQLRTVQATLSPGPESHCFHRLQAL